MKPTIPEAEPLGNYTKLKETEKHFLFFPNLNYGIILIAWVSAGLASYGIFVPILVQYKKFDN